MRRILYILFIFTLSIAGCQQDKDVLIELPLFSSIQIESNLGGQVLGANYQPIADATVKLNSASVQTDENGFFTFYNSSVNSKRASLEISKPGYFNTTRAVVPQNDATVLMKIELIEKTVIGELEANQGGNFTLANGTDMVIPADVITDIHGNAFTGQARVVAEYLDLDESEAMKKMPGDMLAKNANDENVLLEIFGLMVIEMKDNFDQTLKIASNENIQVRIPIPSSLAGNIPDDISLWYFDIAESVWKEKGMAALENDMLVSTTNELSFIAFARAHEAVTVKGKLTNLEGESLSNMPVTLKVQDGGIVGASYTGIDGVWQSEVPKGITLEVNITDNCGDNLYNANIGGYWQDLYIVDVAISQSEDFFDISANLLDCNDAVLENGYVLLEMAGQEYVYPISEGNFKVDVNRCNNDIVTLTVFDKNNNQQSETISMEIANLIDFGAIKTCQ